MSSIVAARAPWAAGIALALALIVASASARAAEPSPAERRIEEARRTIAAQPDSPEGYNALAMAYARRARETSDVEFYRRADEAVAASLARAPDDFEARKARVWIALGKHEYARALEEARELNRRMPDDVLVYGYLTDAAVELGAYEEAERAAQWMLDLRPGNVAGLTRAAYLRELFGDPEGAVELMEKAYQRTPAGEREDRAWITVHLAHLQLAQGKLALAEQSLDHAFALFPDYHYAVALLAQLRTQQRRFDESVQARRRHVALAPHPENLYELGVALVQAGQRGAAQPIFADFERRAQAEAQSADNANRQLAYYYVDHARAPRRGLEIAELEAARRQDVYTLQTLAWALSANGRHADARRTIDRALAVGVRDAAMLYRAGVIAQRSGDRAAAARWFAQSLEINPRSELATAARRAMASAAPLRAPSLPVEAAARR
jgi:tetratricopeptide (TPR) repeat protein